MNVFLRIWLGLLFTVTVAVPATSPGASTTNRTYTLPELEQTLRAIATHPRFDAAMLGVKVESLDTGKVLFEQHAAKLLKPASNGKLYTGALALDRLGPDYRIRTSFYATSSPDGSGLIDGDLIVYGRGDPSFSHRFNNGNYRAAIDQLADAVTRAGIKSIRGDLVGDESFFRGSRFGVGWSVDDLQYYYGAEVSALSFQENTIDLEFRPGNAVGSPIKITTQPGTPYLDFRNLALTVAKGGRSSVEVVRPVDSNVVYVKGTLPLGGSRVSDAVAVHNAPLWFITALHEALKQRGVAISGKLRTVSRLDREVARMPMNHLKEVAFVVSRPMSELVAQMMKPSQNLYAQLLLLQVGEKARAAQNASENSDDLGLAELKKFCAEAGIARGAVLMEEGAGLSRGALLQPAATVQLLKYMDKHRHREAFLDSLPIAGVDGTLKNRFKGTLAEKNLRAKTGTIRYVNSLSGYVTTQAGERLAFAIMLNAFNGSDGRAHVDALAESLAGLAARTGE